IETQLKALSREGARLGADIKWVKPDQFHLTLQFLGECPEDQMPPLSSALENAAAWAPAFSLTLGALGGHPLLGSLRVVWLDLLEGEAGAKTLADGISEALKPLGFFKEDRAFHAHITLGRPRDSKQMNKLRSWMEAQEKVAIGPIPVDSFALIR